MMNRVLQAGKSAKDSAREALLAEFEESWKNSPTHDPEHRQDVSGHVLACPRHPVAKLGNLIPIKYIEALEQNQKIASCCRHPENHDIEAWRSNKDEKVPDIYKFICTCGRTHVRFCVGGGDTRPYWEIR